MRSSMFLIRSYMFRSPSVLILRNLSALISLSSIRDGATDGISCLILLGDVNISLSNVPVYSSVFVCGPYSFRTRCTECREKSDLQFAIEFVSDVTFQMATDSFSVNDAVYSSTRTIVLSVFCFVVNEVSDVVDVNLFPFPVHEASHSPTHFILIDANLYQIFWQRFIFDLTIVKI